MTMRVIRGGKAESKRKVIKALKQPKIEIERNAHKFDEWLDQARSDNKAANPDRYFVAFVELHMPIATSNAWPSKIRDTFLFEQPDMPSLGDVISTVKKGWKIANRIDVINFHELSAADYQAFLGDESEWTVIDE